MQPFSLEKPVAHSTASKFSAVLIGRIVSRYIFNSVVYISSIFQHFDPIQIHKCMLIVKTAN